MSAGLVSDCAVAPAARKQSEVDIICSAILAAYDRLAEAIEPSSGFNGATVRKVDIDKVREEVRSRGFFDANEKGHFDGDIAQPLPAREDGRDPSRQVRRERREDLANMSMLRLAGSARAPALHVALLSLRGVLCNVTHVAGPAGRATQTAPCPNRDHRARSA